MDPTEDILDEIQSDTAARLAVTPGLALASIVIDDDKTLESKVEQLLTKLAGDKSKLGLCIIVMKPEIMEAENNLPGPVFKIKQTVQVIEHPTINLGSKGTHLRCGNAAIRVLRSLHLASIGSTTLYADKSPAVPLPTREGFISYMVTVFCHPSSFVAEKTGSINPSWNDGDDTLSLTCATSGSSIFYTSSGKYPHPNGVDSIQYAGPITGLEVGTRIRAAAYSETMNPGDVMELYINSN